MKADVSPTQLGYLGLEVSNIAAWRDYANQVLGLQAESVGDTTYLRMDDYSYRVSLHEGPRDDLSLLGWEVADEAALQALKTQLTAAGVKVKTGDAAACDRRRVVELIEFNDPNGIQCEAYCGPLIERAAPFQPTRAIGGFVTGDLGFGHITMTVDSLDKSLQFYREVLGLRLSDWVRPQPERGVASNLNLAFLRCNRRHHSLAFFEMKLPKRLHHFMLQVNDVDDVGSTYYLAQDRKIPIELSLGRHTNDGMLSFYMHTPSGFSVEYGWGAREVDEATWRTQLHTTGSSWGHRHAH
jgi:2,3-dihydroxybiphenyl 1,2-dioxygenase